MHLLPKARETSNGLTKEIKTFKEMGVTRQIRDCKTRGWNSEYVFEIYALYIPPYSKPGLSQKPTSQKIIHY